VVDKHVDNVQVTDGPGIEKEKGHPHNAGEKAKTAPRKKDNKGYEPGEDEKVYEEFDAEEMSLEESTDLVFDLIQEALHEFMNEEATEEEAALLEEVLATEEGCEEFLNIIFEEEELTEECDECGEKPCVCDDDGDDVIDDAPKLKGRKGNDVEQKEGYGSKKKTTEEKQSDVGATTTTKRADVKMIKTRTPEGKVIYRRQRSDVKVNS